MSGDQRDVGHDAHEPDAYDEHADYLEHGIDTHDHGAHRRLPKPLGVLILVIALLVAGGGLVIGGRFVLDRVSSSAPEDFQGTGSGEAIIRVEPGHSASRIAATLLAEGVVASEEAFRRAARDDARALGIQPGFYRLRLRMSAAAALALMLDPSSRVRSRVTIPEGTTVNRTLEAIAKNVEGMTLTDLKAAAADPAALGLPAWAQGQGRLEGFLFPATYDVEPGTTAVEVLKMLVARFQQAAAAADIEGRAAALGITPYEVLVIASLVEAETPKDSDRPRVAQVVYNRLEQGMKLDFDSTVKYVFELRGERKTRILLRDLQVDSTYNTYRNKGLPPGPINSPGEAALLAALEPEAGPWLYFVVKDTEGNSAFAETYAEHQRNVERYRREVQGQG